ncbi:hypothetical protein PV326_014071, partial [Microctonus aethiopoides]
IIARRIPYKDIYEGLYRILWAVFKGIRPPLIPDCPSKIQELYTQCWSKSPNERPSMHEIVKIMTDLFTSFSGIHHEDALCQIIGEPVTNCIDKKSCGSGLWMAPEVFRGSTYSEKCDIYSWSVILWVVFSRRIPLGDMGKSPILVAYAVCFGLRLPVFDFIPIPIQCLLKRCWTDKPEDRPAMNEIVGIMSLLHNSLSEHLDDPGLNLRLDLATSDSSWDTKNIAGLDVMGPTNKKTIDRISRTLNKHEQKTKMMEINCKICY